MKITLVRHGETIENANHIIQGQLPGVLTARGKNQALDTADKLKDTHFDAIYCSDLQRCVDTAKPIIALHTKTPVIYTKELRERKGGSYEGKYLDLDFWETLPGTELTRKYPGGESWQEVKLRLKPFLNDLYAKNPDQSILMISHGGPIRGIRSYLENRSLDELTWEGTVNGGIWHEDMVTLLT
jgi:broad specificity phosphatase PhoE